MAKEITLEDVIKHMDHKFQLIDQRLDQSAAEMKHGFAAINARLDDLETKVWEHVKDISLGLRDHEGRIKKLEAVAVNVPELLRSYGTRSVAHSGGKKRAKGSDLSWPPGGPGKNHKKWLVPVLARVL